MRFLAYAAALVSCLLVPSGVGAATVSLGFLSFDELIPSGTAPGVNTFTVANLTGNPLGSGFALPPEFPVFTSVTFLSATLSIEREGATDVVNLGDLSEGFFSSLPGLEFPADVAILSATFEATLSTTALQLADNSTFLVGSPKISAKLLPLTPPSLSPGADFVLLTVSDTAVPEPGVFGYVSGGLLLLVLLRGHIHKPRV